jgi:multicomponent Na+:H+ antiporter subunit D
MLFLPTRVRGVIVGGLVALGALSIAGVPPAAGFIGKLEILRTVAAEPAVIFIVVLGSLLSFVYAFQIYQFERWRPDDEVGDGASTATWRRQVVPVALGVAILAIGLWPEPLAALSDAAAAVLVGPP